MAKDIAKQGNWKKKDIVPSTLDELFDWASITQAPDARDITRRHILVYAQDKGEENDNQFQVTLRVQGFVHKLNLKPTGNWNMLVTNVIITSWILKTHHQV